MVLEQIVSVGAYGAFVLLSLAFYAIGWESAGETLRVVDVQVMPNRANSAVVKLIATDIRLAGHVLPKQVAIKAGRAKVTIKG